MTKASDNVFPRLLISEGGSTSTPASGRVTVYAKSDGLLYSKDDAGAETALGGGSAAAFCGASVSGTSTATNNSSVALAFADADTYDTDSIHDPSSNNTRLTVPTGKTGKWMLTVMCAFGSGTSDRRIGWRIGAGSVTNLLRVTGSDGGSSQRYSVSTVISLTAADYVEVVVFTDTSATQNPYSATFTFLGA